MAEKDDVIAATSGIDSLERRQTRQTRIFHRQPNTLSSRLLEQLGLPERGSSVTVKVPTAALQFETFAPTVKVRAPDGSEVPSDKVTEALQKILDSQDMISLEVDRVRKWQVRHTIIGVIIFIGGIVSGNVDRISNIVRWVREMLNVAQ